MSYFPAKFTPVTSLKQERPAALLAGALIGCSNTTKTADVSGSVRKSLEQAGFKDVSTSDDRDKGVVKSIAASQ